MKYNELAQKEEKGPKEALGYIKDHASSLARARLLVEPTKGLLLPEAQEKSK